MAESTDLGGLSETRAESHQNYLATLDPRVDRTGSKYEDMEGGRSQVGNYLTILATEKEDSGLPGKPKATGACRVCGDEATGMYFGALVCVPCKTFFLRYAGDNFAFICKREKNCEITISSRTQCKFCRMRKCLNVGMCRKERPSQVHITEGQQRCVVCQDLANGVHFGAITCEGCKKFFRRGLTEHASYVCKSDKMCLINPRTRNSCRHCRYQKCIVAGMSREAIQMGRPSKIKYSGSHSGNKHKRSCTDRSNTVGVKSETNSDQLSPNREFLHDADKDGSCSASSLESSPVPMIEKGSHCYQERLPGEFSKSADEFLSQGMTVPYETNLNSPNPMSPNSWPLTGQQTNSSMIYPMFTNSNQTSPNAQKYELLCRPSSESDASKREHCAVCNDKTTHFHFGISCQSCKDFFIKAGGEHQSYTCKNGGRCGMYDTKGCRDCRYQRCLQVGMDKVLMDEKIQEFGLYQQNQTGQDNLREAGERPIYVKSEPVECQTRNPQSRCLSNMPLQDNSGDAVSLETISASQPNTGVSQSQSNPNPLNFLSTLATLKDFGRYNDVPMTQSELENTLAKKVDEFRVSTASPAEAIREYILSSMGFAASEPNVHVSAAQTQMFVSDLCNTALLSSDETLPITNANDIVLGDMNFNKDSQIISLASPTNPNHLIFSTANLSVKNTIDLVNTMPIMSQAPNAATNIQQSSQDYCCPVALQSSNDNSGRINQSPQLPDELQNLDFEPNYWIKPKLPDENLIFVEDHWRMVDQIIMAYNRFVRAGAAINKQLRQEFTKPLNSDECGDASSEEMMQNKIVQMFTLSSVAYCQALPGFTDLPCCDQYTIVRLGQSQSRILAAAVHWYKPELNDFEDFMSWRGEQYMFKMHMVEYARRIHALDLDTVEAALLNVLVLMATDYPGLKNSEKIEEKRTDILKTFRAYTTAKFGTPNHRIEELFSRVPELRKLGIEHHVMTFLIQLNPDGIST